MKSCTRSGPEHRPPLSHGRPPAARVTADEAHGRGWHFRRLLEQLDVGHVVAVPKPQQIKSLAGSRRIDELIEEAPGDAGQRPSCGGGAKGPRVPDRAAAAPPTDLTFDPDPPAHHRWAMARRNPSDPGELAYAPVGAEIAEPARAAGFRRAIEECLRVSKNECGPDEYEVRRHVGRYRHITLAVFAHAVLTALAARTDRAIAPGRSASSVIS